MKKNRVKKAIEPILPAISLAYIAQQYFGKSRQNIYQKINNLTINGTEYNFSDGEIDVMINGLKDINRNITKSIGMLQHTKRIRAKHYTNNNPFNHQMFKEWLYQIPNHHKLKYLEPFAGSNNIIQLAQDINNNINDWSCYDIEPPITNNVPQYKIIKRDTIKSFPSGYDVIITNPPYLGKSSASRRKLNFPDTHYDDLYKLCLDIMLNNCPYVAAIIPESFITSGLFHNRLFGVISLNSKMFNDTDCPVCLGLFIPNNQDNGDFKVYIGDDYVGMYNDSKQYDLSEYVKSNNNWVFNDSQGSIGVKCVDSQKGADIYFHRGEIIDPNKIKVSSRAFTRIGGLPENIDLDRFIAECNKELGLYRDNTKDIFMTSFKGLRKDGKYRRRIDFKTIRYILNKVLKRQYPNI
ncbi:DUF5053 domain-containing protein [Dysgonomonas sp. 520]|uniref:DUF5053 domain-containing protein n=1 Tax=Dysgonomonas sp. 520 TaxID=2302931 RepID=UPI0013CFF485|nr:DUF5053 domain-containing protein [Dysgonomonas sp. 520]NDW10684.1 DUF5053 domain-containing protein [Dysgonomonas sp. 520]